MLPAATLSLLSPTRSLLGLVALGAIAVVVAGCSQGACGATDFCAPNAYEVTIESRCANLVSAQDSCGQSALCSGPSPCSALTLDPPPQGGDCQVTITFSGGATKTADADWGGRLSDSCCGPRYERLPATITFCPSPSFPFDAATDALSE